MCLTNQPEYYFLTSFFLFLSVYSTSTHNIPSSFRRHSLIPHRRLFPMSENEKSRDMKWAGEPRLKEFLLHNAWNTTEMKSKQISDALDLLFFLSLFRCSVVAAFLFINMCMWDLVLMKCATNKLTFSRPNENLIIY